MLFLYLGYFVAQYNACRDAYCVNGLESVPTLYTYGLVEVQGNNFRENCQTELNDNTICFNFSRTYENFSLHLFIEQRHDLDLELCHQEDTGLTAERLLVAIIYFPIQGIIGGGVGSPASQTLSGKGERLASETIGLVL